MISRRDFLGGVSLAASVAGLSPH
ncbi:MAG: twin-arginine translocation signal domain-containing protein [Kordiimonadaceae bacterium]|nr:twin-arginine translocation signal domain-containing protein [Kordiimonadaceae bacterium]